MYGRMDSSRREVLLNQYLADVEKLVTYLPWLYRVTGQEVRRYYEGDGAGNSFRFPVYDSTLMSFVKDVEQTQFITKNYPYLYTHFRIRSAEDERNLMKKASIYDLDLFRAILSKYILEGKRKGTVWSDGVQEGIYVTALECLSELFFRYSPNGKSN